MYTGTSGKPTIVRTIATSTSSTAGNKRTDIAARIKKQTLRVGSRIATKVGSSKNNTQGGGTSD